LHIVDPISNIRSAVVFESTVTDFSSGTGGGETVFHKSIIVWPAASGL
jgi:hypothetical protein